MVLMGVHASAPSVTTGLVGRSSRAGRAVLIWTALIAILVVVSSVSGLVDPRVYALETENWALQASGQDLGNLLAVIVLAVAGYRFSLGSTRAGLVWLGTLLYLVYAFVVYAVAVHLNHLFLVYVAVLGLSSWALLLQVGVLRAAEVRHPGGSTTKAAAYVLGVTGVLFAGLWLSELVPALVGGTVPASLTEAGLWVNPIHVIDLSLVLPAFVVTAAAALRNRETGLFWLGPWLVFSVLMGSSIVAAMGLMMLAGTEGTLPAAVAVSLVVVASLAAALAYLRSWPRRRGAR